MGYFSQFKKYFLDDVLFVVFTVEVDVELDCDFAVFEYAGKCFEDKVDKPHGRLLFLKHLDHVLFEEVLDLAETVKKPVLG